MAESHLSGKPHAMCKANSLDNAPQQGNREVNTCGKSPRFQTICQVSRDDANTPRMEEQNMTRNKQGGRNEE
eukprot:1186846-Amphidinium_carterae.1